MPPIIVNPEPFERLVRELELRVVEVQLAQAESLLSQLRLPTAIRDAVHLARVHHGELFGRGPIDAAEVLANRRALAPRFTDLCEL